MQHLTHINNIGVLFVVDPFESANNIYVDEIENKYLLVLNLNELHLPKFNQNGFSIDYNKAAARYSRQLWACSLHAEGLFQISKLSIKIPLLFVILKAKCLSFYAEI